MRPLSPMEAGIWRTDQGAPLNFTTVARVSGPLTADAVRAALPAVRARHVWLRAQIAGEPPAFVADAGPPLTLKEAPPDAWLAELDREINEPFDPKGALARFVLAGDRILITLHHSIGDGMSGVFLVRDLLQAVSGAPLSDLPIAGSVDAGLPPAARGWRALGNHLRFVWTSLWTFVRSGFPVKVRRDRALFSHSRRARVMPQQLDAAFAEKLSARARAEKTTVHGALSAAMILGVLADAARRRGNITFGTPINVRAQLVPPVGEQLGFYVSMLMVTDVVRADMPLWELARLVRRRLERMTAQGGHLSILSLIPPLFSAFTRMGDRRKRVEAFERMVPSTSGLTNLGRLAVQTQYGALTLDECFFAACPSALGDFLATATSLHGKIFWNFIWPDPVLTEAHAEALVGGIVERLKGAVERQA